ncbi:MAG: hypothetical protein WAU81_09790 [Candidatus Aminicenantales bacterium]
MNKGVCTRFAAVVGVFACLFFLSSPQFLIAQDNIPKGNVIGFLYAKDGTTPLQGAVVKFKNLTSGLMLTSSTSDGYGIFKLEGIESGLYTYGVVTEQGDFNADSFVGLKVGENETAKLSIALDPYEEDAAEAISEVYRDQEKNGEALIGTIADFNPNTRLAQVQIVKGVLQVNDKIHARGKSTNFYQDVGVLMIGSNKARRVLKGQTGTLKLEQNAQSGDLVYVVPAKKIFPLFLAPLGIAAVIGGNEAVTYGILKIKDHQTPVSAIINR